MTFPTCSDSELIADAQLTGIGLSPPKRADAWASGIGLGRLVLASADRIVATRDFSGLTNWPCALAEATTTFPIALLERCMAIPHLEEIKADGS